MYLRVLPRSVTRRIHTFRQRIFIRRINAAVDVRERKRSRTTEEVAQDCNGISDVGLAIIVAVFRYRSSADVDDLAELKG